MSLLTTIVTGGLGQLLKEIIGTFKVSPEKKLELETLLAQNDQQIRLKQMQLEEALAAQLSREIEAAGANIRAEAQSGDKFTSRARPTFMYVVNAILVWNFIVVPIVGRQPIEFPEALFWLFGSTVLGYTGARTWEKVYKNGQNGGNGHATK